MNYIKIYEDLVRKAKESIRSKSPSTHYESHHIVPRSMGGGNEKSNLVLLTPREHFIAHRLLTKIYPSSKEMKFAVFMMTQKGIKAANGLPINSSTYEKLRADVVVARREFAFIPNSIEFDNNIKLSCRVTSKLRSKWKWSKPIKSAIAVIVCNGILAYEQSGSVCYRRGVSAYSLKTGRCTSKSILKALDILVTLGYVEDERSDPNLPVSEIKLSVYRLTDEGYNRFTTLGEKV